MKKLHIWIVAIAAALGFLAIAIWFALTIAERGYQDGATNKRINDTHRIAEAIEVFRRQTGALPYAATGKPPIDIDGRPPPRCTSTRTAGACMPARARLCTSARVMSDASVARRCVARGGGFELRLEG